MARLEGWPAFFVLPVVRNILPGGFFAGQDIPELLDDSLLLSISKTKTLRLRQVESYLSCRRSGGARASIPAEKKLDSGFYAACAGLRAQSQALELIANSVANISTTG